MIYLLESEGFYMLDESKETLNQEETANEVKEEVSKDVNVLLPDGEEIKKPEEGEEEYDVTIENARLVFEKKYKNGRRNSYIAMAVVLALGIGSVVCIGLNGMVWKIIGWSLVATAVVGMLVYYIATRNILPNATKAYIAIVNENMNKRNFSDPRYTDVTTDKNEKLELADPISDHIYKDPNNIASRNVINGKFMGRSFKVGDLGLYSGAGKSRRSLFVGKYVSYQNDLHFENRYILTIKGTSAVDLPDDVDDLKVVFEEGDLKIYGPEGSKPEKDLGKDFIKKIKSISVEKHLLNLNVVVWSGHSSAYGSYDDVIMTLPFEKEFDKEPNEQYANNLLDIMEAFALLIKTEK